MYQTNSIGKKSGHPRFLLFLGAFVALWVLIPALAHLGTNKVQADGGFATLVANLTGDPIGEATPRGSSAYFANATGTPSRLTVSVSNVNLPEGTQLSVALNDASIGTITLDDHKRGFLSLSSQNGGTVPTVVDGDTLTVGSAPAVGGVTYLSGTFAAPATPSPSGTHTPHPTPSHTPFPTPSHTPWPTPSHTPWPSPSGTPLPARVFAARMNGAGEVPPVTTNGQGFGFVALNSDETQIRVCVGFRGLSSDVTAVTINGPASASENGPVIFTLTLPASVHGFASQTFDVTASQVTDLRAGLWYLQVATANNTDGEIRGQLAAITQHGPNHGGHHGGGGDGDGGGGGHDGDLNLSAQGSDDSGSADRSIAYVPVPFDFDEDGIPDIAVFHPADGDWYVTRSSDGRTVVYKVGSQTE